MAEITQPFNVLLKKDAPFQWQPTHELAFEALKAALTSPLTMIPPQPGKPLLLYITSTPRSIGGLLAQEVDGVERPVYYISRVIQGAETRYDPVERHCLALIFATRKLRHYLLAFTIHLVTKCDPIRFLLSRPALVGRPARWLLSLAEYDIICKTPKAVKSQALADLLAHFPSGQYEPPLEDLPGEDFNAAATTSMGEWVFSFDGSSTAEGGGAGIVLTSPDGLKVNLSYKLDFKCSNNEAEYEALALGLLAASHMGIQHLCIAGDSNLVVKQTNGEYAIKEATLASYRTIIQRLTDKFESVRIEHAPRSCNRHPDALATLASKVSVGSEPTTIKVFKRTLPCSVSQILPEDPIEDWRTPIRAELLAREGSTSLATLKHFTIHQGVLYYRGSAGILARCIGLEEAARRLHQIHARSCGTADISLYRRIQRQGYYWPSMTKEAAKLQNSCSECLALPSKAECNFIEAGLDWRQAYIDYLAEGSLPANRADSAIIRKRASRFFLHEGQLFRHGYHGSPLRCLSTNEAQKVLRQAHESEHQGGAKLYQHCIHLGYYWPTMESDSAARVKHCQSCQIHGNRIHSPAVDLRTIGTPWPFHTWAMDLVGPINPPSRRNIWMVTATELYTKWVEAIPLRRATGPTIANFIREYIICRFGLPKVILSDNGTPFVNKDVGQLLASYEITHHKSTPYYPQGNGQAEATNKTLIKILSRTLEDHQKNWAQVLPLALWAYRTSKRRPTQMTPFSLVYGAEAVLPVEIAIPSARIALRSEVLHDERPLQLEALDERRDKSRANVLVYQRRIARAYDNLVRPREFSEGDLVLRAATHVMRGSSSSKFAPKWEGPFVVKEATSTGYYRIATPEGEDGRTGPNAKTAPINAKWLKAYYP